MDKNVLKITQGALMTAIFGAFVFINRQTAGFLQEILVYIYPLPIAIYAARYGFVTGLPAMAAMALISLLLASSPLSAFYAVTSLLTGLALGGCLNRKASAGKTLFAVMAVSVLVNLIDLLFGAFLSGITIDSQVTEMQVMMQELFTQYEDMMSAAAGTSSESMAALKQAMDLLEKTFNADFLKRILVISTVVIGLIQGFLIYQLSLLIMRRLRIKVPAPKNILAFRPPVWTAYAAAGRDPAAAVARPESGKTVSAAGNAIPDRTMSIAERIALSQKKDED